MIKITNAGVMEIPVLHVLAQKIWPEAYREILSENQVHYMLEKMYSPEVLKIQMQQGHVFLILYIGDVPSGFASYECHYQYEDTAKLHKIYLLPEIQGQGLGRVLLNKVVQKVKKLGQVRLLLNVNRSNNALHFYKRYGFAIIAEEDIDIGNGYFMNDYIMELSI